MEDVTVLVWSAPDRATVARPPNANSTACMRT
jgi:hypothetical protein